MNKSNSVAGLRLNKRRMTGNTSLNVMLKAIMCVALISFTLGSCKKRNTSSSQDLKVLNDILKNDIKFKFISIKGKVKYNMNGSGMTVASNLRIKKEDKLWSRVSVMGIEGMRTLITTDSVKNINRLSSSYVEESIEYLNQAFGVKVNYNMVEALVLGDVPLADLSKVKVLTTDGFYILTEEQNGFEVTYKIDTATLRMTELIVDDKKGTKLMAIYKEFKDLDGQQFANVVEIEIKQKDQENPITVTLTHKKIKKSITPLEFPFKIPKSFQKAGYDKK